MSEERKIYTIPSILSGFVAYVEGEDDRGIDNVTGWGRTEAEAIADLEEKMEDEA